MNTHDTNFSQPTDTATGAPPLVVLQPLRVRWRRLQRRCAVDGPPTMKRAFDIASSLLLLILLSPVFLLLALLVKLEDGGPVIFVQMRIGKFGRPFRMFKFRSMHTEAEERLAEVIGFNQHSQGVTFKHKRDPRMTRTGRLLRRLSLDELPQIFNVLIGDMSLVGPRPPVPREVVCYTLADRRRLAAAPGITCLWQIKGRSEIDFSHQVQLDVEYIEKQSFWFDLMILLKTVPAVIGGRGAC